MITEGIKNRMVRHCGNFAGARRRVYIYYRSNNPSTADFAVYLKNAWGQGGAYPALEENGHDYSYSTIQYKKNGVFIEEYVRTKRSEGISDEVLMPWTEVAKRTADLIDNGEFLTDAQDYYSSRWDLIKLIYE